MTRTVKSTLRRPNAEDARHVGLAVQSTQWRSEPMRGLGCAAEGRRENACVSMGELKEKFTFPAKSIASQEPSEYAGRMC